jgi:hypothetical protein
MHKNFDETHAAISIKELPGRKRICVNPKKHDDYMLCVRVRCVERSDVSGRKNLQEVLT